MNIYEAFKQQIETTALLVESDLGNNKGIPIAWNGVIFRLPDGNIYSSGKEMKVGDKLLTGYVVRTTETPIPFILEESEISFYEDKLTVIRVVDGVPIFEEVYNRNEFKRELINSITDLSKYGKSNDKGWTEYAYGLVKEIDACKDDKQLEQFELLIASFWEEE